MRKLTTEEFIERARKVHGNMYDYSKAEYVGANKNINIICPIHGSFWQRASFHLGGMKCRKCSLPHKLVYGIGVNDVYVTTKDQKAYSLWVRMLHRCYDPKYLAQFPTYKGCIVCDEWVIFSNFKDWFDKNYVAGYQLDKDILGGRTPKRYSPLTCCFVPQEINKLLIKRGKARGDLPIGVGRSIDGKYRAHITKRSIVVELGTYNNPEEAFKAYKEAKEAHIKEIASEYYKQGKISQNVYESLLCYEVSIDD